MHMSLGDSFGVAGLGMLLIFVELSLLRRSPSYVENSRKLTAAPNTPRPPIPPYRAPSPAPPARPIVRG
jgi:hypothetical protein